MKRKIIKIVCLIFIIAFVIVLIHLVRNIVITNRLYWYTDKYLSEKDFSYEINFTNPKKGIIKIVEKDEKTTVFTYDKDKNLLGEKSYDSYARIPTIYDIKDNTNLLSTYIATFITSEEYEGIQCYHIYFNTLGIDAIIEKDTGYLRKWNQSKFRQEDGTYVIDYTMYSNIQINK